MQAEKNKGFWHWARLYFCFGLVSIFQHRNWRSGFYMLLHWPRLARIRVRSEGKPATEIVSPFTYTMH